MFLRYLAIVNFIFLCKLYVIIVQKKKCGRMEDPFINIAEVILIFWQLF